MWLASVKAAEIEILATEEDLNDSIVACIKKNHRNCEDHTNAESDNKNKNKNKNEKRSCLCWCHKKDLNLSTVNTNKDTATWYSLGWEEGFLK
jgi:hypothetical protein